MIRIDGSQGEGGGQILRSAITLSILTGQAMQIYAIRAHRSKPGLMAQHLKAVEAAMEISHATVEGAYLGSQSLTFQPGAIHAGRYLFEIGTAGSTSLVLQTIFTPLSVAQGASTVTLTGGTHVPWSPCYHYLAIHWLPYMQEIGFNADMSLETAGFYPQGGGRVKTNIRSTQKLTPLELVKRGRLLGIQGISAVSNLDPNIATRQKHQALRRLEARCRDTKIKTIEMPSPARGTFLLLLAQFEYSRCCYFALGERGKPAERVADEAVDAMEAFLATDGAIDQYLADQLLVPLAITSGPSQLSTSKVTQHLCTNADIIREFLPVKINIQGDIGEPGLISVTPAN